MKLKNKNDNSPEVIYEGFLFPHKYKVVGETDLHDLNENNSQAKVYIGPRNDIEEIIKDMEITLLNCDIDDNFVVIGLWDNHSKKSENDYLMLAIIDSHQYNDGPFEYLKVPTTVHQLTDNSKSESTAWIAWTNLGEDYNYETITPEETKKVAEVLVKNISSKMLTNIINYEENDFLKSLLPVQRKLKM